MSGVSILPLPCTRASSLIGGLLTALIQINPMSLSFSFTWCDVRCVNTPSALYQGFKYSQWVVDSSYSNKSPVLELWFHSMQCKMCQYSFYLVRGLQVLLVGCGDLGQNVNQVLLAGCWECGQNVKCAMWVVIKHFEKFPSLFARHLLPL
jgi:hypothetical protein